MLAGLVRPPLVPVTVTADCPMKVVVLYAEVSVSVALPEVLMVEVESWPITPAGNPLTESVTGPVNPLSAETFTE